MVLRFGGLQRNLSQSAMWVKVISSNENNLNVSKVQFVLTCLFYRHSEAPCHSEGGIM